MATKNVGITLLSIVAAIAAFIVSNIWAQSLQEKVNSAHRAREGWNTTYQSVKSKEIDIGAGTPADLPAAQQRLRQRLQMIEELRDDETPLWQTEGATREEFHAASTAMDREQKLETRSQKTDSLESATALDKDADKLLQYSLGVGVLMDEDVRRWAEDLEKKESRVRWAGYILSILALLVAGIAQLSGKG